MCVCVCHRGKPASRWTGDFWSKSVSLLFGIPLNVLDLFVVSMIFSFLTYFLGFWFFATSLLCIIGELAGGGSVAVAVGVSDR